MLTLSIDPSINNTGIAIFNNKILIEVNSLNGYELAVYLYENMANFTNIVIENSKKQKACWNKHFRSIGQVDAVCNIVIQAVKDYNKKNKKNKINFIQLSPLQKGSKINFKYMQPSYPQFKLTQDIADAIKIGEMFLIYHSL